MTKRKIQFVSFDTALMSHLYGVMSSQRTQRDSLLSFVMARSLSLSRSQTFVYLWKRSIPFNEANGGTIFRLVNKKRDAEKELEKEFFLTDAVSMVRDKDIQELLPVAMYFGVNILSSDIRYKLDCGH